MKCKTLHLLEVDIKPTLVSFIVFLESNHFAVLYLIFFLHCIEVDNEKLCLTIFRSAVPAETSSQQILLYYRGLGLWYVKCMPVNLYVPTLFLSIFILAYSKENMILCINKINFECCRFAMNVEEYLKEKIICFILFELTKQRRNLLMRLYVESYYSYRLIIFID